MLEESVMDSDFDDARTSLLEEGGNEEETDVINKNDNIYQTIMKYCKLLTYVDYVIIGSFIVSIIITFIIIFIFKQNKKNQ